MVKNNNNTKLNKIGHIKSQKKVIDNYKLSRLNYNYYKIKYYIF